MLETRKGLGGQRRKIFAAETTLLAQTPERGSEGLFRRSALLPEASPIVRIELIEERFCRGFVGTELNGLAVNLLYVSA